MFTYLKTKFKQFMACESGGTTVEFMFAMPLIMFWVGGTFTFYNAYSEYTKSVKATYTIADILSRQYEDIDNAYIDSMNLLFANFMRESTNDVWLRITSIEQTGGGLTVGWSTATGIHNAITNDADIPVEIIPTLLVGESTILVESHVNFIPFLDWVGLDERTFTNQIAVNPRFVSPLGNADS